MLEPVIWVKSLYLFISFQHSPHFTDQRKQRLLVYFVFLSFVFVLFCFLVNKSSYSSVVQWLGESTEETMKFFRFGEVKFQKPHQLTHSHTQITFNIMADICSSTQWQESVIPRSIHAKAYKEITLCSDSACQKGGWDWICEF